MTRRAPTDCRRHTDPATGSYVDWTQEPAFAFTDEIDALEALAELGDELRAAQRQVLEIQRYLRAAVYQAVEVSGATSHTAAALAVGPGAVPPA